MLEDDRLADGQQMGRFVILRDVNGQRHAVAAGSIAAMGELEDGALLLLPGGRMIHVAQSLQTVLRWFGG